MSAPYTSDEHRAALDAWMEATDRQRSEAFYRLFSLVGGDAQSGNEGRANVLRALLAEVTS